MRIRWDATLFVLASLLLVPGASRGDEILYGGNGGHGNSDSINDGFLLTVNPATAAVNVVGHPDGVARLTGLAFDPSGALFASTMTGGGFPPPPPPLTSTLIRIDPSTGQLLSTIGPIRDGPGGPPMSISEITFQPGTGVLFGVRTQHDGFSRPGWLYTIDKTTAVATLVGNASTFFATIAFAPNGTLYEVVANLGPTGPAAMRLVTLNPANAAILSTVNLTEFFGALAFRQSDGALFGSTGDDHEIFRIDPATGQVTLLGDTGKNFVGALAFSPPPPSGPPPPRLAVSNLSRPTSTRTVGRSASSTQDLLGENVPGPLLTDSGISPGDDGDNDEDGLARFDLTDQLVQEMRTLFYFGKFRE